MRWNSAVVLAVAGFVLPYAVGIGGTVVLGDSIGNHDFYHSGRLAAWDDATTVATLVAYALGLVACIPWLSRFFRGIPFMRQVFAGCCVALVATAHLAAVFVVRFAYYISTGGIL
jgi:hypothetical protein